MSCAHYTSGTSTRRVSFFAGLRTALESGLPPIRNSHGGHGQGPKPRDIDDHVVELALNPCASSMFLWRWLLPPEEFAATEEFQHREEVLARFVDRLTSQPHVIRDPLSDGWLATLDDLERLGARNAPGIAARAGGGHRPHSGPQQARCGNREARRIRNGNPGTTCPTPEHERDRRWDAPSAWELQMRMIQPWVGEHYADGVLGHRVLLLGESNYSKEPADDYTEIIRENVQDCVFKGTVRFFTKVATVLLLATGASRVTREQVRELWQHVAFTNYVQKVFHSDRVRPSADDWTEGRTALEVCLREHQPHIIIVMGLELATHLEWLPAVAPDVAVATIAHPSSFGFSYAKWVRPVEEVFLSRRNAT